MIYLLGSIQTARPNSQDLIHYEVPRKLLNGFSIADHGGVPPDQGTCPPFPTPSDPSPLILAIADQGGA